MESAEIAGCVASLHASGGAERGRMMLFGVPSGSAMRPLLQTSLLWCPKQHRVRLCMDQEVLGVAFEGLACEYGDMSSSAGPGTVLSLAEGVKFVQRRTGNCWGEISSPEAV